MVFMSKLRRAIHALVAVSLLAGASARAGRPYRGGAVATAYPPASEAALLMLKMGGNAVDAAVAAAFVAGVAGPYHNGIGGGGFALLYDAKAKKTEAFDFREVAPLGASHDMYLKDGQPVAELSRDGATSVAVPGAVKGYLEMLKKHGTLSPSVVLAPAIALARTGIWVTPKYQSMARLRVPCLAADADAARLFLRPNPKGVLDVPEIGTVLKNPELARTLMKIAAQGASAFYSGPIARAIADTVQRGGGVLSEKDLAAYKTRTYTPLEGQYRGYRIAAMPPPSAGGLTVLEVLGQLETLLPKGYSRADLYDPWMRYLPAMAPVSSTGGDPSPTSATSATPLQGGQPDDAEWPAEDELPLDTDQGDPSPWAATSATPLQGGDPADIPGVDDGPALCSVCGQPLDPALAEPTHPSCSPDERAS